MVDVPRQRIEVAAPSKPAGSFVLTPPAGGLVEVKTPPTFSLWSYTFHVLFERHDTTVGGFQVSPVGTCLVDLLDPEIAPKLIDMATVEGDLVGLYQMPYADDPDVVGSEHRLVWQGKHHDIFTYDHDSLKGGLQVLSLFTVADSSQGATLTPKKAGLKVLEESVTLDFGQFLVWSAPLQSTNAPPWTGTPGRFAEFYELGPDGNGILAVSETAVAKIESAAKTDEPTELAPDFVDLLLDTFSVEWDTRGAVEASRYYSRV